MTEGIYTENLRPRWESDSWNTTREWEIVLPHQCDSWEIGSVDDARRLVADLLALIEMGPPGPTANPHKQYAPWIKEHK